MMKAINATCDVYRSGNTPPAAPDVAGLAGHLQPTGWPLIVPIGSVPAYTHVLLVELTADVRDAYDGGTLGAEADRVYVPDKTGTAFTVLFVERVGRGSASDHKRVYLQRRAPSWPTDEI